MRQPRRNEASLFRRAAGIFHMQSAQGWVLGIIAFIILCLPVAVSAVASISQGYTADAELPLGSIVSLKNNTADQVTAATTTTVDSILGVVVNDESAPLTLSNGQDNQVQVATSGIAPVLVSDINGEIAQGDHITASPIKGVGMKATANSKVVGIAQGAPRDSGNKQQTYTNENGEKQTLKLGEVAVLVNVAYYFSTPEKTIIPSAIQNVVNSFAGKKVEPLPIIISALIFIITLVVVVSIIYSMIRSSIISVGRNPMAQSAVYRDVIQLSLLVLGILAVAVIAIYIILTRF